MAKELTCVERRRRGGATSRRRRGTRLVLVLDDVLEALLAELPLEHPLLQRAGRHEAVRVALVPLAVAPAPRGGLLVRRRVPVQIEHHQSRTTDQVQPAAAGLGR